MAMKLSLIALGAVLLCCSGCVVAPPSYPNYSYPYSPDYPYYAPYYDYGPDIWFGGGYWGRGSYGWEHREHGGGGRGRR